jgi:chaperonin GroES
MKIRPMNDYVVVVRNEAPEKSPAGIIFIQSAKEKPTEGRVISVGPGQRLENGDRRRVAVEPGNIVLFMKHSGQEIDIDGVPHLFIREDDILAVQSEPST